MPRKNTAAVKAALVAQFGGGCQHCGYNRSMRALQFHHIDPSEKYDWNESGASSHAEIQQHPERFALLCANCHFEEHERLDAAKAPKAECVYCGTIFNPGGLERRASGRGKYCSKECCNQHRAAEALKPSVIKSRILSRAVPEGGCLIWIGAFNPEGRPTFSCKWHEGRQLPLDPRRVLYEMEYGKLPPKRWLTTSCGNPNCICLEHIQFKSRKPQTTLPSSSFQKSKLGAT